LFFNSFPLFVPFFSFSILNVVIQKISLSKVFFVSNFVNPPFLYMNHQKPLSFSFFITSANKTHHTCLPPSFIIVGWKVVAWLGHAQQATFFSFLHCLSFLYCVNLILNLKPLYPRKRGWNLTMKLLWNLSLATLIATIDHASLNSAISSFSIFLWAACSILASWILLAFLDFFSSFFL
jgi:hypothetical protein